MDLTVATFDVTLEMDFCGCTYNFGVTVDSARSGSGQRIRELRIIAQRVRTDNMFV